MGAMYQKPKEKKCKWVSCWWGAITVPGQCAKKGNMMDSNCSLFLDEEEKIKDLTRVALNAWEALEKLEKGEVGE